MHRYGVRVFGPKAKGFVFAGLCSGVYQHDAFPLKLPRAFQFQQQQRRRRPCPAEEVVYNNRFHAA
jgi:hypothetical protein